MFNHNKLKATIDDGFQPELVIYNVMPDMHKSDVSRGIVQNGVYPKNSTVKDIRDMIHGNYIGNKNTNGLFTYAIDMNDNIIVGKRNGNGTNSSDAPTPHPTLIGGKKSQGSMCRDAGYSWRKNICL